MTLLLWWAPLVLTEETDFLWSLEKVKFLKEFIEKEFKDGGLLTGENDRLIALYGGWGTWKSSVMKTLHEPFVDIENKVNKYKLDDSTCKTFFFEAWRYEKDDNLALSLFHFLLESLYPGTRKDKLNDTNWIKFFNFFKGFSKAISLNIKGIQFNPKDLIDNSEKYDKEILDRYISNYTTEKDFRIWINESLKDWRAWEWKNKSIVIFIDDLDRCESENIINLLSAIKLFFTYIPNVVFVVWIDKSAVTLALKRKYGDNEDKATEYLEKIFTINFNLRQIIWSNNCLLEWLNWLEKESFENMIKVLPFENPRHIKKLLNKYALMRQYVMDSLPISPSILHYRLFFFLFYLSEYEYDVLVDIEDLSKKRHSYNEYIKFTQDTKLFHINQTTISWWYAKIFFQLLPCLNKTLSISRNLWDFLVDNNFSLEQRVGIKKEMNILLESIPYKSDAHRNFIKFFMQDILYIETDINEFSSFAEKLFWVLRRIF